MAWADFNPKTLSRDQFVARLNELKWRSWSPIGIVLHNTAAPTLAQWAESGPAHDARIRNLQKYYEGMGWHGGPHWFISRNWINEFSNPLRRGTHSPSYNGTHFGIEMVGNFAREEFDSGDGALVRDNAAFVMAALCRRFDWDIGRVLKLHKEDPRTDHDCPGRKVSKADVIRRVRAEILRQKTGAPNPTEPAPTSKVLFQVTGRMSTFGGPKDMGVGRDEGLALFTSEEHMRKFGRAHLLLLDNGYGLARRLNPEKYYVSCRWPRDLYGHLRNSTATLTANGRKIEAYPVDWGPNEKTGRVADLSPGAARALDLQTDDAVTVTVNE